MPIKVLVVDDSRLMRDAVMRLFSHHPDIQPVGQAASFSQAIELAAELRPEVIVMDMHMRDERDVPPAEFKASVNGARLLAMSLWNDIETQALADRFGAAALLDKMKLATELLPAIRQCATNRRSAKA